MLIQSGMFTVVRKRVITDCWRANAVSFRR